MSAFKPTEQQQAILDVYPSGEDMVIDALAGTGKTSVLRLLGGAMPEKSCLYIAYNKAIQLEAAATFPANVACKTAHSLAYGWMVRQPTGKQILAKLKNSRVTNLEMARILKLKGIQDGDHSLTDKNVAALVMQTIGNFCNSADSVPGPQHVPFVEGFKANVLAKHIAPAAVNAWEDICSPLGQLRFAHDHYLKMWALSSPVLRYDAIFFDEAQDANPCIAKVVTDQACQKILVGDPNQAIYGWRGAVDAMQNFDVKHRLPLSQSFRFGPAVAESANLFLKALESDMRVEGFEKIDSKVHAVDAPDAILCRTNAGVIASALDFLSQGKSVHIVGGTQEIKSFAFAAIKLMKGETCEHPELGAFKNWTEVCEYVQSDEGKDLKVMVNLINIYGVNQVLSICNESVKAEDADIIVSTAHKSKGLEWDSVRIGNDFRVPDENILPGKAELMLLYVSVTRAKLNLDMTALEWIKDMVNAD